MNTKEMVETAILLSQVVSKKTVLEALPTSLVDSVTEELERLLKQDELVPGPTPIPGETL